MLFMQEILNKHPNTFTAFQAHSLIKSNKNKLFKQYVFFTYYSKS